MKNLIKNIGNYFIFKGNLNRFGFIFAIAGTLLVYNILADAVVQYKLFELKYYTTISWAIFCYLYGICIAARLRNMKFNPYFAYFFVIPLWAAFFLTIKYNNSFIYEKAQLVGMLMFFIFLPLFAKDKKTLGFGKSEK
ncbi:MAG: hypothetical protein II942_03460 [Alphaproteobacteria bacterium]|nr:hypothetical protein [Alphaproteobacteria bacterium]